MNDVDVVYVHDKPRRCCKVHKYIQYEYKLILISIVTSPLLSFSLLFSFCASSSSQRALFLVIETFQAINSRHNFPSLFTEGTPLAYWRTASKNGYSSPATKFPWMQLLGQKSEAGVEVPVEPVSDDHFSLDL